MKLGLQLNSFDWVVARYADACSLRPGPQVPDKLKPRRPSPTRSSRRSQAYEEPRQDDECRRGRHRTRWRRQGRKPIALRGSEPVGMTYVMPNPRRTSLPGVLAGPYTRPKDLTKEDLK